jgi:RNA recognition motif-containing protein
VRTEPLKQSRPSRIATQVNHEDFAFVEMTNAGEARDAIRTLNGSVHGGRALIVNEARPKLYCSGEHESLPSRDHRRHRI